MPSRPDLFVPPRRQLTTLGRTGLETTVAGLGCGGLSRLGLRKGGSMRDAANVVSQALDLGIRFIDTAKVCGTEPAVGMALKGRRDGVVVSTKLTPLTPEGRVAASFIDSQIDDSLALLGLETIDVMHLHGLRPPTMRGSSMVACRCSSVRSVMGRFVTLGSASCGMRTCRMRCWIGRWMMITSM
jgi:aryl-alcohol dehydrogenase-like predicted oxidoreductase